MRHLPPIRVHLDHQLVDEYPAGHEHFAEGPPGREELVIVRVSELERGDELRVVVKRYPHRSWHAAGEQACAGPAGSAVDCPTCHNARPLPVEHIGHPITGLEDPRLVNPMHACRTCIPGMPHHDH